MRDWFDVTMAGSGCFSCLRFLVVSLNTLVLLTGLGLTALGSWLVAEEHVYLGTASLSSLSLPSLSLVSTGLCVLLVAFIGCCGALTSSRCLLGTFSLLLVTLVFGQLSVAGLLYFKQLDYGTIVKHVVQQTVQEKYQTNNTGTVLYWDHVQTGLSCCGVSGPGDWAQSQYGRQSGEAREIGIGAGQLDEPFAVPLSCCRKKEDTDCSILVLGSENLGNIFYSKGCADELVSVVGEHLVYGLVAGLGLVLTEVLGLSLSLCLCCTLARIEARKA